MGMRDFGLKEKPVSTWLPYNYHQTPEIVSLQNGSYVASFQLAGRAHESESDITRANWIRELNHAVCSLGDERVSLWSHVIRRRVREYPQAHYTSWFCRNLDDKYRATFDKYSLMVNDLYLSVVFNPSGDPALNILSKAEPMSLSDRLQRRARAIQDMEEINRGLQTAFSAYGARPLKTYDHNGYGFTEVGELYAYLINGEWRRIPVLRNRLGAYLARSRPLFDEYGELAELRSTSGSKLFGMVEITDYDDSTEPGHLNGLLHSNFEFVMTNSFSIRSNRGALAFLARHGQQLRDAQDAATSQIEALGIARDHLASGKIKMGEHHAVIRIMGETPEIVRDNLTVASGILSESAIESAAVDTKAIEAAFWSQLPGNGQWRPRPCPITSENFLSFSSFHNYMSGKADGNPWGAAVSMFKTDSGTPLYFSWQASPVGQDYRGKRVAGNTAVIGKTGTGKTAWLCFAMAQSQKFPAKVAVFDLNNGMELAIRAMHGRYLPLEVGVPSGWNPLHMAPTARNLAIIRRLVVRAVTSEECAVTHRDMAQINQAIKTVMFEVPREHRRFGRLLESLPDPTVDDLDGRPTVHARLAKWCNDGENAWLFDNPVDELDLSRHQIFGFDLTELIASPELLDTAMQYLLHRTESLIDGSPFMYVADEFWRTLDVPALRSLARNKVKTIRKQNGIFVYATQEPGDAINSPIGPTLIQGCATFVFLPNPDADRKDYVEGFKCTEAEFEIIRQLGEKSRKFLLKQGGTSTVADFSLVGFDDEMEILSGTPDTAVIAREIIAKVGDDPEVWVPQFLDQVRGNLIRSHA